MIQRIQSVWFLLASACAFLSLKMPFFIGTNKYGIASYKLTGTENIGIMLLTIVIGSLAFVTIFLFKKRRLQIRLSVFGIMLELFLIFLMCMEVREFLAGTGSFALTSLLHSLVLLFFFLAIRGIGNDARIIRESNRLR